MLLDTEGLVSKRYYADAQSAFVVIRPDRYIGFYGNLLDELMAYLEGIILRN